jgi:hypothetical protein
MFMFVCDWGTLCTPQEDNLDSFMHFRGMSPIVLTVFSTFSARWLSTVLVTLQGLSQWYDSTELQGIYCRKPSPLYRSILQYSFYFLNKSKIIRCNSATLTAFLPFHGIRYFFRHTPVSAQHMKNRISGSTEYTECQVLGPPSSREC